MKSRAEQAAEALWAGDEASRWFGFVLADISEGHAVVTLSVAPHHCNGHGMLHGGVTFALADSAFAFACNSRGQATVAQANSITYLAPGQVGDTLHAEATERHLRGKNGIYDVTVSKQDGTVIAEFRGQSRAISGCLIKKEDP